MGTGLGGAKGASVMSQKVTNNRPDTQGMLRGLKGFQRDTVEYAFDRLYQARIRRTASWWPTKLVSGRRSWHVG